jgi:hypothetical protein
MALWGNKDTKSVTGTVAVTNSNTTVTGTGTEFATELKAGNSLVIATVPYGIAAIANTTSLTLSSVYAGSTASGLTVTANESPAYVVDGDKPTVFGVDTTEYLAGGDNVTAVAVAVSGTRYLEVPAVTFSGGEGSSAAATASISGGAVSAITVTNVGSAYTSAPTVTVAKPRRIIPTSGVTIATEQFAYTTHGLVAAESVKYFHGGGTAVTGLTNDTEYFVSALGLAAGTFRLATTALAAAGRTALAGVAISGTAGQFTCTATTLAVGDHVVIGGTITGTGSITGHTAGKIYEVSAVTGTSPNVTGFTLTQEDTTALVTTAGNGTGLTYTPYTIVLITGTGNNAQYFEIQATADQATAVADLGSGAGGGASAGWVLRKVGTGGRAGRVTYETLVAMRSITSDAEDIAFPDA